MATYLINENGKSATYKEMQSLKEAVETHMGNRTTPTVVTVWRVEGPGRTVRVGTRTETYIETIESAVEPAPLPS